MLKLDSKFLQGQGFMDYSLFLVIETVDLSKHDYITNIDV